MDVVSLARKAHRAYSSGKIYGLKVAQLIKGLNRVIFTCDIAYQVDIPLSTKMPYQGMG